MGSRRQLGGRVSVIPEALALPTALLLCGEGSIPGGLLTRTVAEAGFDVVATVRRWSEAVHRAADLAVDVVVVDLALTGSVGVRLIPVLRAAVPSCEVIAISPLDRIDLATAEAGAAAVVQPTDLRPLIAALRRIAALRAGV
jgi:two-component system, NarL family, response regulator DesR